MFGLIVGFTGLIDGVTGTTKRDCKFKFSYYLLVSIVVLSSEGNIEGPAIFSNDGDIIFINLI